MPADKSIILIELLLQHLERSTEQILLLKRRVAVLEAGQARMVPSDPASASRVASLVEEIAATEEEILTTQSRIEENERRLAESTRKFARVQAELMEKHFAQHGAEARAIIMAERKRLRTEYPRVVADLEKRVAAMSAEEVRHLQVASQGSIHEAAHKLPWMRRVPPFPQGAVDDWRRFVKREGNRYEVDLEAVREPVFPSDSLRRRVLGDGIRKAHPDLHLRFIARRPRGPWPAHVPFPPDGFDERPVMRLSHDGPVLIAGAG